MLWCDPSIALGVLKRLAAFQATTKDPLNDASTLIKIGEYMAAGRPIVSFDLQESRITAGEAALYAEPNDESSFAAGIDELLDDQERRSRMGELGRKRVERLYSWEHSKAALLAVYERAVSGNGWIP